MVDLNSEVSENCFCNINSLKALNKGPTCFTNSSYIDFLHIDNNDFKLKFCN